MPPFLRVLELSTCWNSSKMRSRSSGAIPTPVSVTATWKLPSSTFARMLTDPASVNLIALLTRFRSTWVRRRSSPRPCGRSAGASTSSASFFSAASASVALTTSSTSSRIE